MKQEYILEKWIWTEADLELMGWHDCRIHATACFSEDFEFALDIDYIFEWIDPLPNETYFQILGSTGDPDLQECP